MALPPRPPGLHRPTPSLTQLVLPLLILLPCTLAFAYLLPKLSPTKALAFGSAIVLFVVCLFSTRAALLIIIFSMLLGPEFQIGGGLSGAAMGRGVTLRVNDFVLTVVGFSWLAKMAINKQLGLFLKTPMNAPIAWYTVICILASALGVAGGRVQIKTTFFYVVKYFEYMFVYFMVVNHLRTRRDLKLFILGMLITCFIASVVGIAQIPGGGRITAPFEGDKGEPNTFGGYLAFMVAYASGLFWTLRSTRHRLALGCVIGLALLPLLHTGSRGSYLALLAASGTMVLLSKHKAVGAVLLCLGLGAMLLFAPDIAKRRVEFTFEQGKNRTDTETVMGVTFDTSSSERIQSWKQVASDMLEHPLLGYGVTGYKFIDGQYFRVVIETGLVGLALFAFLLGKAWHVTWVNHRRARDDLSKGLTIGFMAGFVGLLAHSLSANTFIIGRIMEPFWFTLGMVVMLPRLTNGESSDTQGEGATPDSPQG